MFIIHGLIVISIITFSISTLPNLSPLTITLLNWIECIIVLIFSLEYLWRITTTHKPIQYVFSFYGLIDLIAVLPFYLAFSVDLRAIRMFRLFRLFRIFKLLKYNQAINRYCNAFASVKEELILFSIITIMMIYLSAVGIYYFEHDVQPTKFSSVFHSLWWAISTLTTVGYGDIYPITTGGKIFTFFILMTGLGTIAIPSGLVASALTQTNK
jgi:voltage-gated potassium channel